MPANFYEDGIESLETSLRLRQVELMERWKDQKNVKKHTSRLVSLISGQTSRSNQGATHYLSKKYNSTLRKQFGRKKAIAQ